MQLSYDPAIALLGTYPRKMKTYTHTQNSCTWMILAFLLVTAKNWKQSRCPLMGKQFNKLQYIHTKEHHTPVKRNCWECVCAQSCPALCNPTDYTDHQTSQSMEFSRQEYWSGLPFPPLEDLTHSGIKPSFSCISCIGRQILYHCTTLEHYTPVKRSYWYTAVHPENDRKEQLLIHRTIWINLQRTMMHETRQSQKTGYCIIPCM